MTFAKKYRFRFIDVAPLYCKKKNNGDFTQNKKSQGIFISDFSWRRNPPFQPDKTFHNNSSSWREVLNAKTWIKGRWVMEIPGWKT